jgi:hypothetical protein
MGDTQQAWQVKRDGAGIETVIGSRPSRIGGEEPVIRVVPGRAGQVITDALTNDFVKRWDAGEEHARSLVDRVIIDATTKTVISLADSGEEDQHPDVPADASAAQEELDGALRERDAAVQRAETAEAALTTAQEGYRTQLEEVQGQLTQAQNDAAAAGDANPADGRALNALVGELNVETLNKALAQIDDGDRERVLEAERAGKARSSVDGIEAAPA